MGFGQSADDGSRRRCARQQPSARLRRRSDASAQPPGCVPPRVLSTTADAALTVRQRSASLGMDVARRCLGAPAAGGRRKRQCHLITNPLTRNKSRRPGVQALARNIIGKPSCRRRRRRAGRASSIRRARNHRLPSNGQTGVPRNTLLRARHAVCLPPPRTCYPTCRHRTAHARHGRCYSTTHRCALLPLTTLLPALHRA